MAYLAEGAFDKRLSDGENNELECIKDLAKYGLQYKKNDEQKKTDLVDVHNMYPNIEVKLCKTKYPAMCNDEPLYIFIQRYKDSRHGYFDSGPWDTIKDDPKSFFCKYYRCKNFTGFYGFKAADLVAYCEKAIKDGNYFKKYDSAHNIGNVHESSCKVVYMFFLPHVKKSIKTYSSVEEFAEAVFASERPAFKDLYDSYVRSSDSPHQHRLRTPERPVLSPLVRPSVPQPPMQPLVLT